MARMEFRLCTFCFVLFLLCMVGLDRLLFACLVWLLQRVGYVREELRGLLRDHVHSRHRGSPLGQHHDEHVGANVPHRFRLHLWSRSQALPTTVPFESTDGGCDGWGRFGALRAFQDVVLSIVQLAAEVGEFDLEFVEFDGRCGYPRHFEAIGSGQGAHARRGEIPFGFDRYVAVSILSASRRETEHVGWGLLLLLFLCLLQMSWRSSTSSG